MSDRVEKKLQHVAVARYEYRHDAEFAAGFLDDAGIPYRLQVDDPALGISIGVSATLWVRGMDVERARDLLEVEDGPVALTARPRAQRSVAADRARATTHPDRGRPGVPRGSVQAVLDGRARLLALVLAGATVGLTAAVDGASMPDPFGYVAVGAAAILAVVGIVGRAPGPIRRILSVLSGGAP